MEKVVCLLVLVILLNGCTIVMVHDKLKEPAMKFSDTIKVMERVEGEKIHLTGFGSLTIICIPVFPSWIKGDANVEIMKNIAEALRQVGYQVVFIDSGNKTTATEPILKCKVLKYGFYNYTYLFPLVITWGGAHWKISLVNKDDSVIWSKDFKYNGNSFHIIKGHHVANKRMLNKMLNALVDEFSSKAFHDALVAQTSQKN